MLKSHGRTGGDLTGRRH